MITVVPMTITAAKEFIEEVHRHHRAPQGGLFAVGAADRSGKIVGAAIVGRPVARALQDGFTCEVTRLATDGTRNACSLILGACRRAARDLGYLRIITYTLASEPGTSLRASGWHVAARVRGRDWSCPSRPRETPNLGDKIRWEANL